MARIRSAKPEWWKKEKWCRLPRDIRFTYKGIWEAMADDQGRFQADARLVKAEVWPLDDDITTKKIDTWLTTIAKVNVSDRAGERVPAIRFYIVDGVRYGYLAGFEKHQKISHASPSKFPPPPEPFRNHSGNAPESLRPDDDMELDRDLDIDIDKDTEGTSASVGMETIAKFVAVANRGLADHIDPKRRQPIPRIMAGSAKSRAAAEQMLAAGVPIEFAEREIYDVATKCEPDGQITSLNYFAVAVTRRWQAHQEEQAAGDIVPLAPRPRRAAIASRFAPASDTTKAIIAERVARGRTQ